MKKYQNPSFVISPYFYFSSITILWDLGFLTYSLLLSSIIFKTIAIFISFKIPFPIYVLAIWLGRKATPVPFNRIESICG